MHLPPVNFSKTNKNQHFRYLKFTDSTQKQQILSNYVALNF